MAQVAKLAARAASASASAHAAAAAPVLASSLKPAASAHRQHTQIGWNAHASSSMMAGRTSTGGVSMQRWLSTSARSMAASAPAAASSSNAAAAAAASSSSSSSSSASTASSSRMLLLCALGGTVVGGLLLSGGGVEVAHAEAGAVSVAGLPTASSAGADLSALDAGFGESAAVSTGTGKKRGGKGKKKRTSVRKQLPYPGKLANLHRDASALVQVPTSQGLRMQIPLSAYPQQEEQDKQVVLVPVLELGGQQGPSAMLIVNTMLGRAHKLEAQVDTTGAVGGNYKWTSERGFSLKPSMSVSSNGTMWGCEVDWKGREQAVSLVTQMAMDWSLSYAQALTPSLTGGVELHYGMGQFVHLNGGARWISDDQTEQLVVSKKDSKYQASYSRRVFESPHFYTSMGLGPHFPSYRSEIGVETLYSSSTGKSDVVAGIKHTRHSYTYHAALSAAQPSLAVDVQMDAVNDMPNCRVGLNAMLPLDSNNEALFGVSFVYQM